jgi:hypothetical protein
LLDQGTEQGVRQSNREGINNASTGFMPRTLPLLPMLQKVESSACVMLLNCLKSRKRKLLLIKMHNKLKMLMSEHFFNMEIQKRKRADARY